MKGHIEIVEMLLEKTVDIDRKNEDEQTPLLVAAKEGRPRQVKYQSVDSAEWMNVCLAFDTNWSSMYSFPGFAR